MNYQIRDDYHLYVNLEDTDRYVFTGDNSWFKEQKFTMFKYNYDVISHKKFYRVNLSERCLKKGDYLAIVKQLLPKLSSKGVVRLKVSRHYEVNSKYKVVSSEIF